MKGMPVTSLLEDDWAWELRTSDLTPWKERLFQLLESYTTGDVARLVVAGEDLRRKAFTPRTCVLAQDLKIAIALWEKDVSLYQDASGELFPLTRARQL